MLFRKMRGWVALIMAIVAVTAQAEPATEFRLQNGMKVIVREDHRSPTAVHMIWYRAGSMDETSGTTGVAHVLEHMMFKGTRTLKPGEFSRRVAALGGRENAFTGHDYTAYYQQIDHSRLADVMKLEAERMANLKLSDKEFRSEIQVIMEERRWRTDDRATAVLYENLYATALTAHPYRWPIIGWMADLQQMKADDARRWYRQWYAPNNATMVVVGDVQADKVRRLAEKYFGRIPARPVPVTRPQDDPPQRGMRRVVVKAPAENSVVALAYKVPVLRNVEKDDDAYALDVLEAVLDGYDNARLTARLVRAERVANSVSAQYSSVGRGPGLFILSGMPVDPAHPDILEQKLRGEIERIANEGITEQELQRVKTQLVATQIYKRDAPFEQAMEIGTLEMAGIGYRQEERLIARIKAVTARQVQDVAKKYFNEDALTVATLVPQPVHDAKASQEKPKE